MLLLCLHCHIFGLDSSKMLITKASVGGFEKDIHEYNSLLELINEGEKRRQISSWTYFQIYPLQWIGAVSPGLLLHISIWMGRGGGWGSHFILLMCSALKDGWKRSPTQLLATMGYSNTLNWIWNLEYALHQHFHLNGSQGGTGPVTPKTPHMLHNNQDWCKKSSWKKDQVFSPSSNCTSFDSSTKKQDRVE